MTIELYSGVPGSGKSYHATRTIYESLRYKKKPVICNYDLNGIQDGWDFHYLDNWDMKPSVLQEFAERYWSEHEFSENGIVLVIDECQLVFNSREWQNKNRMEWLRFFSQHRHYGYKVIFIAQFDRMVDRQIRALIEYEYVHRRLRSVGKVASIVDFVFNGVFVAIRKYYPLNQRLDSEFFKLSRKICSMYETHKTIFDATDARTDGGQSREGSAGGSLRIAPDVPRTAA